MDLPQAASTRSDRQLFESTPTKVRPDQPAGIASATPSPVKAPVPLGPNGSQGQQQKNAQHAAEHAAFMTKVPELLRPILLRYAEVGEESMESFYNKFFTPLGKNESIDQRIPEQGSKRWALILKGNALSCFVHTTP